MTKNLGLIFSIFFLLSNQALIAMDGGASAKHTHAHNDGPIAQTQQSYVNNGTNSARLDCDMDSFEAIVHEEFNRTDVQEITDFLISFVKKIEDTLSFDDSQRKITFLAKTFRDKLSLFDEDELGTLLRHFNKHKSVIASNAEMQRFQDLAKEKKASNQIPVQPTAHFGTVPPTPPAMPTESIKTGALVGAATQKTKKSQPGTQSEKEESSTNSDVKIVHGETPLTRLMAAREAQATSEDNDKSGENSLEGSWAIDSYHERQDKFHLEQVEKQMEKQRAAEQRIEEERRKKLGLDNEQKNSSTPTENAFEVLTSQDAQKAREEEDRLKKERAEQGAKETEDQKAHANLHSNIVEMKTDNYGDEKAQKITDSTLLTIIKKDAELHERKSKTLNHILRADEFHDDEEEMYQFEKEEYASLNERQKTYGFVALPGDISEQQLHAWRIRATDRAGRRAKSLEKSAEASNLKQGIAPAPAPIQTPPSTAAKGTQKATALKKTVANAGEGAVARRPLPPSPNELKKDEHKPINSGEKETQEERRIRKAEQHINAALNGEATPEDTPSSSVNSSLVQFKESEAALKAAEELEQARLAAEKLAFEAEQAEKAKLAEEAALEEARKKAAHEETARKQKELLEARMKEAKERQDRERAERDRLAEIARERESAERRELEERERQERERLEREAQRRQEELDRAETQRREQEARDRANIVSNIEQRRAELGALLDRRAGQPQGQNPVRNRVADHMGDNAPKKGSNWLRNSVLGTIAAGISVYAYKNYSWIKEKFEEKKKAWLPTKNEKQTAPAA